MSSYKGDKIARFSPRNVRPAARADHFYDGCPPGQPTINIPTKFNVSIPNSGAHSSFNINVPGHLATIFLFYRFK